MHIDNKIISASVSHSLCEKSSREKANNPKMDAKIFLSNLFCKSQGRQDTLWGHSDRWQVAQSQHSITRKGGSKWHRFDIIYLYIFVFWDTGKDMSCGHPDGKSESPQFLVVSNMDAIWGWVFFICFGPDPWLPVLSQHIFRCFVTEGPQSTSVRERGGERVYVREKQNGNESACCLLVCTFRLT